MVESCISLKIDKGGAGGKWRLVIMVILNYAVSNLNSHQLCGKWNHAFEHGLRRVWW